MTPKAPGLADIDLVITDVDGVLTDGRLIYNGSHDVAVSFNVRDGVAVRMLQAIGVQVAVISGRKSAAVEWRLRDLGVLARLGEADKATAVRQVCALFNVELVRTCFIGDDLNDLPAFALCGVTCCPDDACDAIVVAAKMPLTRCGGQGVLRELAEAIIAARGLDIIEVSRDMAPLQ